MSNQKSVIVYGPQGCGKTPNAAALMAHFGLDETRELESFGSLTPLASVGILYLTNYTRTELIDMRIIEADARRVYSFDEAMEQIARAQPGASDPGADNLVLAGQVLVAACHEASFKAGWWSGEITPGMSALDHVQQNTRIGKALVNEKLCLTHSEISEGMEGFRKNLMDDKLPHRTMLEVELADAVIRISDLAGALKLDLGGAIAEKMAFNAVRPDHKKEAREAAGGKSF